MGRNLRLIFSNCLILYNENKKRLELEIITDDFLSFKLRKIKKTKILLQKLKVCIKVDIFV